jgi:hypothetical protein
LLYRLIHCPLQRAFPVSPSQTSIERRQAPELLYPPVYEALRPFFDRRTQWGSGSQELLAYRTLKDHFPEMGPQEIFVVIITARQLFRTGSSL